MFRPGRRSRVCAGMLCALAGAVIAAAPAVAGPPPPNIPTDVSVPLGQLVQTGGGAVTEAARAQSCEELKGGTIGARAVAPTGVPDTGNGLHVGDATDAPAGLPSIVAFKTRDGSESFNRRYWFAVRDGRVWFRSNQQVTGIDQPWRELPVPPCLYGRVTGVQVDDDELIALDPDRRIFEMDHAYREPELFNWSTRWGPLFWMGDGRTLPAGNLAWGWSVLSPDEDKTWPDNAGNSHPVGDDKVSHIWMLQDGGRRIEYTDPWIAKDDSYEACGPVRGRFKAVNLAVSGSTLFVIGKNGDLFTRLYDFDLSGMDPAFYHYSYEDQRGKKNPLVQLPSPQWVRQPKVPGEITDTLAIEKHDLGSTQRTLRVEGRDAQGHTGYWEKDIAASTWTFHVTDRPLVGTQLANPKGDTSAKDLAPSLDRRYAYRASLLKRGRTVLGRGWAGEVRDFNVACSPATVRVKLAGTSRIDLRLHTTDGLRLQPRAKALDSVPRAQYGALEAPKAARASKDPRVRAFVRRYFGKKQFHEVPVTATTTKLKLGGDVNWTFTYAGKG